MKKLLFPLLLFALFLPLTMSADENLCPQYSQHSAGEGFVDYESHEYINGFLSMHFKLAPNAPSHKLGTAYRLLRSSDCQEAVSGWWSMGILDLPQDVHSFSIRFYERIHVGEYKFRVYNDETNQVINCEACDTGFRNIVHFGAEPPHKFWLTLYMPYDFGYIPNLSVLPPTRFIASAQDIQQPEYTGKTPVLIVPGVMGTEIYKGSEQLWPDVIRMINPLKGDDFMDPLAFNSYGVPMDTSLSILNMVRRPTIKFDYSKKLIDDFVSIGYTEGSELFTFPYDWRRGLEETAQVNLKGQIDYILNQTALGKAAGKIDIIAHSQGGLVVKSLLQQLPQYQSKINKLVFVGVPNLGSPKAAKVLLFGDNMDVVFAGMGLDPEEVRKISQNMPSIYQLLPGAQYFSHINGYLGIGQPLGINSGILHVSTLNFQESKEYLKNKNLNSALIDQANAFHSSAYDNMDFSGLGIKAYNIVGCQTGTLGKIIVKPDGHYQLFPQPGDGTVPVFSANNIPGAKTFFALESNHGTMLTQEGIRQKIISLITEVVADTQGKITPYASDCHFNGTAMASHSPADLHIYDEQGKHVGPTADGGFDHEIPNVGYDSMGHENFAFLPAGGIYKVKLIGTGTGSFSFDSSKIQEGEITNTAHYDSININQSSIAEVGLNANNDQSLLLDMGGDGSIDASFGPSSILDAKQSLDFTPPISTTTLTGINGQTGYYRGDVSVSFKAMDPIVNSDPNQTSGLLKIRYNVNNAGFADYSGTPVVVSAEGLHTLQFFSTDKAGNNESVQAINFTIDKTPPAFTVQFNVASKDFEFAAFDNQVAAVPVSCNVSQCTSSDSAGNVSVLKFEKKSLGNSKNLLFKSITNNGQSANFDPNLFNVIYSLNKGVIMELSQTVVIKHQQVANILYNKKLDQSVYSDWSKSAKPVITKYAGLKYLQLQTNNSKIKINLK